MTEAHSSSEDSIPFIRGDAAGDFIVHVDHPLSEARTRMDRSGHGSLLVVDGDTLVGVLAAGDIPNDAETGDDSGRQASVHVRDVMRGHVPHCRRGASIEEAAKAFAEHGAGIIAVINDHEEMVGVMFAEEIGDAADERAIAEKLRQATRVSAGEQEMDKEGSGGRRPSDDFGEIPVYSLRPKVAPE
jgi:CBS domain-containing protein